MKTSQKKFDYIVKWNRENTDKRRIYNQSYWIRRLEKLGYTVIAPADHEHDQDASNR